MSNQKWLQEGKIEAIILTHFDREIKIVEILPYGFKLEADPSTIARSFPLSSRGGELVIYKVGDRWVVSLTVPLMKEKPRPGLASILVLVRDWSRVFQVAAGLVKAYDDLTREGLTLKDLARRLPDIRGFIGGTYDIEEIAKVPLKSGKNISIKNKIIKKGINFFVGGSK